MLFVLSLGVFSPLSLHVFADSYSCSYEFKHQVSVKKDLKATGKWIEGNVKVKSWGGNDRFWIKLFHKSGFSVIYDGATYFSKNGNDKFIYYVDKGTNYRAEFWKDMNGKYIKGSTTIKY